MKLAFAGTLAAITLLAAAVPAQAQVAGSTRVGAAVMEVRDFATGWSAKKQILGHAVFNENGEKVGRVDDIIIAPDASVSLAIIGAGGFLGVRRHDVAVPVPMLLPSENDTFVFPGATREAIQAAPAFEYAR